MWLPVELDAIQSLSRPGGVDRVPRAPTGRLREARAVHATGRSLPLAVEAIWKRSGRKVQNQPIATRWGLSFVTGMSGLRLRRVVRGRPALSWR